ncbi:hypothetical protein SLT36_10110 [Aminobacter sp. BA135]|uniref:hypothetical protein n=1 Tax=Aminobacter sp. BA135 TaxID=537596 RepID=UPI003D79CC5E
MNTPSETQIGGNFKTEYAKLGQNWKTIPRIMPHVHMRAKEYNPFTNRPITTTF